MRDDMAGGARKTPPAGDPFLAEERERLADLFEQADGAQLDGHRWFQSVTKEQCCMIAAALRAAPPPNYAGERVVIGWKVEIEPGKVLAMAAGSTLEQAEVCAAAWRNKTPAYPSARVVPVFATIRAQPDGWRPIETAPKDFTDIVLFGTISDQDSPLRSSVGFWYEKGRNAVPWLMHSGWVFSAPGYTAEMHPTHWMPLPSGCIEALREKYSGNLPNSTSSYTAPCGCRFEDDTLVQRCGSHRKVQPDAQVGVL